MRKSLNIRHIGDCVLFPLIRKIYMQHSRRSHFSSPLKSLNSSSSSGNNLRTDNQDGRFSTISDLPARVRPAAVQIILLNLAFMAQFKMKQRARAPHTQAVQLLFWSPLSCRTVSGRSERVYKQRVRRRRGHFCPNNCLEFAINRP